MKALLIAATSIVLVWDDPHNPPETVAGYNIYRIEWTGTGQMIRHRVNPELIPWQPDTENSPKYRVHGAEPLHEYRGTAVGIYGEHSESEISDDFYIVPLPPVAVRWRVATPP